jgi:hypothetical protein
MTRPEISRVLIGRLIIVGAVPVFPESVDGLLGGARRHFDGWLVDSGMAVGSVKAFDQFLTIPSGRSSVGSFFDVVLEAEPDQNQSVVANGEIIGQSPVLRYDEVTVFVSQLGKVWGKEDMVEQRPIGLLDVTEGVG